MGILEVLAAGKGHDEIELGDNGEENAKKVQELLDKKYTITVTVGEGEAKTDKKVTGFDKEKNEFVIKETVTKTEETELRVPANNAKATAVAPLAGG